MHSHLHKSIDTLCSSVSRSWAKPASTNSCLSTLTRCSVPSKSSSSWIAVASRPATSGNCWHSGKSSRTSSGNSRSSRSARSASAPTALVARRIWVAMTASAVSISAGSTATGTRTAASSPSARWPSSSLYWVLGS